MQGLLDNAWQGLNPQEVLPASKVAPDPSALWFFYNSDQHPDKTQLAYALLLKEFGQEMR